MSHTKKEARRKRPAVKGFTLIELLVVISIISMLASVVIAALGSTRAKGKLAAARTFATYTYHALGTFTASSGQGMGGLWTFDNSSIVGADSSGNGNNVVLAAGSGSGFDSANTYNNTGGSLSLDGTRYYSISDKPGLNLTAGTIGAWVKVPLSNTTGFHGIVAKGNIVGYTGSYALTIYNNQVTVWDYYGTGSGASISSGPSLNDNSWHYVAVSFKLTVPGGSQLYLDGSAIGSPFTYGVSGHISSAGQPLLIGYSGYTPGSFVGNIDDVAVYPQALTYDEIHEIYAAGLPKHRLAQAK